MLTLILIIAAIVLFAFFIYMWRVPAEKREFSKTTGNVVIALAILCLLGAGISYAVSSADAKTDKEMSTQAETGAVPDVSKLEVNIIDERFGDYPRWLLRSSLPNMAATRAEESGFNDAVSIPLDKDQSQYDVGTEWEHDGTAIAANEDKSIAYRQQIYKEIIGNPIFGDMVARFMLEDPVISKYNKEWLQEFVDKTNAAYENGEGWAHWCIADQDVSISSLKTSDEYYIYAGRMCYILEYFTVEGVKALPSIENYHLPPQGELAKVRTEQADYQEDGEAFVLTYTDKNGKVLDTIGFNVKDRRIERLTEAVEPKEEAPKNPGTPSTPGTPDKPDKPDPTPPPEVIKDPADDPVHNGNADKGGGDNKPGDGTGDKQDYDKDTSEHKDYVAPEDRPSDKPKDESKDSYDESDGKVHGGTPPSTEESDKPSDTTGGGKDVSEETNSGTLVMPD